MVKPCFLAVKPFLLYHLHRTFLNLGVAPLVSSLGGNKWKNSTSQPPLPPPWQGRQPDLLPLPPCMLWSPGAYQQVGALCFCTGLCLQLPGSSCGGVCRGARHPFRASAAIVPGFFESSRRFPGSLFDFHLVPTEASVRRQWVVCTQVGALPPAAPPLPRDSLPARSRAAAEMATVMVWGCAAAQPLWLWRWLLALYHQGGRTLQPVAPERCTSGGLTPGDHRLTGC